LRQRLLFGAFIAVAGGAGHGAAFATVHKCVDPVTRVQTMTDSPCPQAAGPTPAEVAATATKRQAEAIATEIKRSAIRADEQLLSRYPDEAAHRAAHVADLEAVVRNIRFSAARFAELVVQRKPLDDEAAFYKGKVLPLGLQRKLEASDASFDALRDVFQNLRTGVADIETTRGREHERLRRLWAGAEPGSMGLLDPMPISDAPK